MASNGRCARYRDGLAGYAEALASAGQAEGPSTGVPGESGTAVAVAPGAPLSPSVSRLMLGAQEDLRREIARAMHDGPAQSLTNIVLQAEIVDRMLGRDAEQARAEIKLLVAMVQQTLDATKSFIFDVRPMVLDDLGLVPTIRRSARERGRRGQIPVEVTSQGSDRRLSMEIESGLFRILDEALAAYLDARPDRVAIRLDWADERLECEVRAYREVEEQPAPPDVAAPDKDLPPALAAMIEDRRAGAVAAAEAARSASQATLPPPVWREISARAATLGLSAELLDEGAGLRLVTDIPEAPEI